MTGLNITIQILTFIIHVITIWYCVKICFGIFRNRRR